MELCYDKRRNITFDKRRNSIATPYEKELCELFDYDRFVFFIPDYQSGARKLLFELDEGLGFGMRFDWIWDLYDSSRKI